MAMGNCISSRDALDFNNAHHDGLPIVFRLMFDLEFFGFLRKPERIHVDKLKSSYRVIMSLNDEMFIGEDRNITRAIHKCAKLIYPNFRKHKLKGT